MSSSSSASSTHRSESPTDNDVELSSSTSQSSGTYGIPDWKPRLVPLRHEDADDDDDADACASEALLALRMRPCGPPAHPAAFWQPFSPAHQSTNDAVDRRASWQRMPNVHLAPRLRRKLDTPASDDPPSPSHKRGACSPPSSDEDDDADVPMPYARAHDVTAPASPPVLARKAPAAAAPYRHEPWQKRKAPPPARPATTSSTSPSAHSSSGSSEDARDGSMSPKLRRKQAHAHNTAQLTHRPRPASTPRTSSSDEGDDAAQAVHGMFSATGPAAKRQRNVPDSMQHIACYFCRRRKIKCGPAAGSDKSCPPCAKRQLPCEYAEKSNRGMRTDLIRKKEFAQSQGAVADVGSA